MNNDNSFENKLNTQYNLTINNVEADGNCFFHSIVDQLSIHNYNSRIFNHDELRRFSVLNMQSNSNLYKNFFENPDDLDDYINTISQNKEWADNYIIQALCNEFNFDIFIYCDFNPDNPIHIISANNSLNEERRYLHIAYVNTSHYVSLRPYQ
jgi:uncharacterized protein YdcH (DUF465 family)